MAPAHSWRCVRGLLLLCVAAAAAAELVKSVSDCGQFLLDGAAPRIPGVLEDGQILDQSRYKPICQTFMNKRRFVTLYDTKNRIPVFSANKYKGQGQGEKRPRNKWKMEPQLENIRYGKNMRDHKGRNSSRQAANDDYRNNGTFQRGHLFPSSYGFDKTDKLSTFTLTNVVPQAASFNQGSWNRMESCIRSVMDKYCVNSNNVTEGFVVTGAQPSAGDTLNSKVNIPSVLWSAFCCYSAAMDAWLAGAHWGANVPDDSTRKCLQTKTLAELHAQMRSADAELRVFPGTRCPLHRTVTRLSPRGKNCRCPSF